MRPKQRLAKARFGLAQIFGLTGNSRKLRVLRFFLLFVFFFFKPPAGPCYNIVLGTWSMVDPSKKSAPVTCRKAAGEIANRHCAESDGCSTASAVHS